MKKILGLGLVAILVMALVGGGTWAYFTDIETSSGNMLVAGTLDLGLGADLTEAQLGGSTTGTWNISTPSSWKPGDNVTATLHVYNKGTIAMSSVNATFSYIFTNGTPSTIHGTFPGGDSDNFTKQLTAKVAKWNGGVLGWQGSSLETLSSGSYNLGTLAATTEGTLDIVWEFNYGAGNGCQGDSANMTLTITGTQ